MTRAYYRIQHKSTGVSGTRADVTNNMHSKRLQLLEEISGVVMVWTMASHYHLSHALASSHNHARPGRINTAEVHHDKP